MAWLRKSAPTEPLSITMAGIKMGDRLLAIGGADGELIAALAAKTGLTGEARVVEPDDDRARRTAAAIERHGALADVTAAPWSMLPFDSGHFDVAVASGLRAAAGPETLPRCVAEVFRVLRPGGRFLLLEPHSRLSRKGEDLLATLQAAGFAAARVLAERGGVRYLEGIKRGT